jgi:hypothetical protein
MAPRSRRCPSQGGDLADGDERRLRRDRRDQVGVGDQPAAGRNDDHLVAAFAKGQPGEEVAAELLGGNHHPPRRQRGSDQAGRLGQRADQRHRLARLTEQARKQRPAGLKVRLPVVDHLLAALPAANRPPQRISHLVGRRGDRRRVEPDQLGQARPVAAELAPWRDRPAFGGSHGRAARPWVRASGGCMASVTGPGLDQQRPRFAGAAWGPRACWSALADGCWLLVAVVSSWRRCRCTGAGLGR